MRFHRRPRYSLFALLLSTLAAGSARAVSCEDLYVEQDRIDQFGHTFLETQAHYKMLQQCLDPGTTALLSEREIERLRKLLAERRAWIAGKHARSEKQNAENAEKARRSQQRAREFAERASTEELVAALENGRFTGEEVRETLILRHFIRSEHAAEVRAAKFSAGMTQLELLASLGKPEQVTVLPGRRKKEYVYPQGTFQLGDGFLRVCPEPPGTVVPDSNR